MDYRCHLFCVDLRKNITLRKDNKCEGGFIVKNKPRKWALVAFLSALFVFAPIAGIEAVQNAIPMVAAEEAVA